MSAREEKQPKRTARVIVAVISALVIAFCAWAMSQYVRGNDPLAPFTGGSPATVQTSVTPGATGGADQAAASPSPDASVSPSPTADAQDDASAQSSPTGGDGDSSSSSGDQSQDGTATGNASSDASSSSGSSGASSGSGDSGGQQESTILVTVTVDGTAAGSNSSSAQISLPSGGTAFDALQATGVSVNARNTQYGIYVAGINGLAEKEHGGSSGWIYEVNGSEPNTSAGNYTLKDGDSVVWRYVNVEN